MPDQTPTPAVPDPESSPVVPESAVPSSAVGALQQLLLTTAIADALHISAHTVQDHLKAV